MRSLHVHPVSVCVPSTVRKHTIKLGTLNYLLVWVRTVLCLPMWPCDKLVQVVTRRVTSDECVVSVNPSSQRGLYSHPERLHVTFDNENNTVPGRNERTCDGKKKKKRRTGFALGTANFGVVKVFTSCCVDECWLKSRYTRAECGAHRVPVLSVSIIYRVPGDVTISVLYHRPPGTR